MGVETNELIRFRPGDHAGRNRLIAHCAERIRALAHKRFGQFAALHRWTDADDVFQNAMLRLCKALESCSPLTAQQFYALSGLQIRRELIDLHRHYFGPEGAAPKHQTSSGFDTPPVEQHSMDDVDPAGLTEKAELLSRMDCAVDGLPENLKELINLRAYHGMSYEDAGALLEISARTARRWEAEAHQLLKAAIEKQSSRGSDNGPP